jgi:rhodanese-related sulfurtransferase
MMPFAETGILGATGTLMTAPALGFAFGWGLERAGLGSARKLAGQFYLTDLTVFKVMFSALLTAMLGAFWLDRFGLLDLQLVYLPETFVGPQLAGGVLFGAGFLFAGLCPGTSCVAAATGRGDGLAVAGGMLLGVLLFNVGYSQFEDFYNSSALGGVTLSDLAGTSRGVMVGLVVAAALGGFAIAGRRVTAPPLHRGLAVAAAALALAAVAVDLKGVDARTLAAEIESERDHISAPDLASLIVAGDPTLRVFDLRSTSEFARMHIPGARHATLDTLSREPLPRDVTIVVYSEGGAHAAQAWVLLRMRGHGRVYFLREGLFEWLARVMEPRLPADATERERADFVRAAEMSRFFGGVAREGVPRADVPTGYWNDEHGDHGPASNAGTAPRKPSTDQMIAGIRRRGC